MAPSSVPRFAERQVGQIGQTVPTSIPDSGGGASRADAADALNGWKEIAVYLGKSVRTVQRWERAYGLPVQRVAAAAGEIVWASRTELEAWRRGHASLDEPAPLEAKPEPADDADRTPSPPVPPEAPVRWALPAMLGLALAAVVALAMSLLITNRNALSIVALSDLQGRQGDTLRLKVKAPGSTAVTRWTQLPDGKIEQLGNPVPLDADGSTLWHFSTDCATAPGEHRVWLDDGQLRRSPQMTLVIDGNPACQQPLPDLVVQGVTATKVEAATGPRLKVTLAVWNLGRSHAVATTTRLRLGRESVRTRASDPLLADVPTLALAPGESATLETLVDIPATTEPGSYYVWAIADNQSLTIEPDSDNNFARSSSIVVAPRR